MEPWRVLTSRSPLAVAAGRDLRALPLVLSAAAGVGMLAWLDVSLTGRLGLLYGTGFVLVALTCATAADVRSLFTPGVLPPVLMVSVVWAVAGWAPEAITVDGLAATAGTFQRVVAGVVDQATALVVGHLAALGVVAARVLATSRSREPHEAAVTPDPLP